MSQSSVAIMTLVVRVERGSPPQRTDALEAAAAASVSTWLATESACDARGESTGLIAKWQDGPRKIVRRARGPMWRQASALADTKVSVGSAEVLGFKVGEAGDTPELLRGMQVSGLELNDLEGPREAVGGFPIIWLNPCLTMTTGKAMAQAGHGAVLAWERAGEPARTKWLMSGLKLSVRTAPIPLWPALVDHCPLVTDGGYTEVTPGSITAAVALPSGIESEGCQGTHELLLAGPNGSTADGQ